MPKIERLSNGSLPRVTWPGCYPLFYFDKDNEILCVDCANKEPAENIVGRVINWEDPHLDCNECNKMIPAAVFTEEEQLELRNGSGMHFAPDV